MLRVVYVNNHKTWRESRASGWYKTADEVQRFLDEIPHRSTCAGDIIVQEIIDVTNRFILPQGIPYSL